MIAAIWSVAGVLLFRSLDARHEEELGQAFHSARVILDETARELRSEARAAALDPAVIEGAARGDWSVLARGASPRLLALTVEGIADLLVIVDMRGVTLVQVPALPRLELPTIGIPADAASGFRVLGGRAWAVGLAPIRRAGPSGGGRGDAVGVVMVARSLERLAARLGTAPSPAAVAIVAGDHVVATTLPRAPATGWNEATRAGSIVIGDDPWQLTALGDDAWILVPDGGYARERWLLASWLVGSLAFTTTFIALAAWLVARRMRAADATVGRELQALRAINEATSSDSDLSDILERALDVTIDVARFEVGTLFQYDEASDTLVLRAQRGLTADEAFRIHVRPAETSPLREVVRNGRVVVNDLSESPHIDQGTRELAKANRRRTYVGLPIMMGGRIWGGVGLISGGRPREIQPDEIRLLEVVTAQIGLAVGRASLLDETTEKSRRLETLARLAQTLTSTLSLDEVLERVTDAGLALFGASAARLWLIGDDGRTLVLRALSGVSLSLGGQSIDVGEGLVGSAVAARAAVIVSDVTTDPRTKNVESFREGGLVSYAAVPLVLGQEVLGALSVGWRTRRESSADEIELHHSLANYAAIAIHNARLFTEEQARRDSFATLLEINKKIATVESPDALLGSIAEEAARLLGVDNATFRLVEGDDLVLAGVIANPTARPAAPRLPIRDSLGGRIVTTGRPLIMNDLQKADLTADRKAALLAGGDTTFLGVPLRLGERTIGVLNFRARRQFTARDAELASAFAGQAAIVLEQVRLYREVSRRAQRMTALADVQRLLSETLETQVVARRIAESLRALLNGEQCVLIKTRADGDFEVLAVTGAADALLPEGMVIPQGTGVVGSAVRERRPVVTQNLMTDPRVTLSDELRERLASYTYRAVLAVPLIVKDTVIGALSVGDGVGRIFDEEDVRLAEAFASQAALCLENSRLFMLETSRRSQIELLAEIEREFTAELNIERLLHLIVDRSGRLFNADGGIYLVEPDGSLTPAAQQSRVPLEPRMLPGQGIVGRCAESRQGMVINDYPNFPQAIERFIAAGMRRAMAQPMVIRDRLVGVIVMIRWGDKTESFGREDLDTLSSFATQAGLALDNARLHEESERRRRTAEYLADLGRLVSQSLDPDQVCRRIVDSVRTLLGVLRVALYQRDSESGDVRVLAFSNVADREFGRDVVFPRGTGPVALALRERRLVVTPNLLDDPAIAITPELRALFDPTEIRAVLAVPLLVGEAVMGVLIVADREGRRFSAEETRLLEAFADQAAVALENTRLYTEARERLGETTTLLAVGQILSTPGPMVEKMRQVAREMARAFQADTAVAYAVSASDAGLTPLAGYHVPSWLLQPAFTRRTIEASRTPEFVELFRPGRAIASSDVLGDPRFADSFFAGMPPHASIFAPAMARGEIIGGLAVYWWQAGRQFSPVEVRLIEGVASQVGLAMENAELARQTQSKLEEMETLLAVSAALSSTLDMEALLRHLLRRVGGAVGADMVGVYLLEEDGEWLAPRGGYRVPAEHLDDVRGSSLSIIKHAFYAEAARARRPVFSADVMNDTRIPSGLFRAHCSQLFVPIIAQERLIGGFVAVWWRESRTFAPSELALMEAIASQAGVALENARLFQENRRQVRQLTVLHELSRAVTGQIDQSALLTAMHEHVGHVFDASGMTIVLRAPNPGEPDTVFERTDGVFDARTGRRAPREAIGLAAAVIDTGSPLRTDDYQAECARRGVQREPGSEGTAHWLGVPMRVGHAAVGVIALSSRDYAFTEADEALLANIADLAALAVRSASLFEERRRAYEELAATQDQLVRTEKLRALGEMASGVAHDFNNLLAAILGRSQLLLRRIEDPKLRQWLAIIERSAIDGAQTVRRLQEFARVRRDQPMVEVDLTDIVRESLDITQSRWRDDALRHGITIEVCTELEILPPVAGDPVELREAMTNLILNAVDAMPNGGTLTLTTRVADGHVQVAIRDTGVGMSESVRAKIFDPFFTTKGPQGTGLGLSMTYGIIARHGATVTVDSEEGRGTTFTLTFPADVAAAPAEAEGPAPSDVNVALRCFVVDDEPAVAGVIGDTLEMAGHNVTVFTDGAAAIERIRAEPFDVVFTDLAMPGVSGWQVADAVRAKTPGLPVFVITGFGAEISAEERRAHGVEGVFAKPLKIEDLLAIVAEVARRRSAGNGAENA